MALMLWGCAGMHARPGPASNLRPPEAICGSSPALPRAVIARGTILLFGEIHGVQELPAIFCDAVCAVASSSLPVEVGLEIPKSDQPTVDRFLESSGSPSDRQALLATDFWSNAYQDGRRSKARVALLDRLRLLRASGLPISVFLFDVNASEGVTDRESKMVENLAEHAKLHPRALTMVLVGEVHAWKTKGAPWDPEFLPMGLQLSEAGIRVRSLGRSTPAGTAWICTGSSPGDCGEKKTGATQPLPSGKAAGIEMLPEASAHGYDGLYAVPTLTASPPAKALR